MERITTDDGAMSLGRQEGRGLGAQVEELALERSTNILSIATEGKAEHTGTLTGKSVVGQELLEILF